MEGGDELLRGRKQAASTLPRDESQRQDQHPSSSCPRTGQVEFLQKTVWRLQRVDDCRCALNVDVGVLEVKMIVRGGDGGVKTGAEVLMSPSHPTHLEDSHL